MPDISANRPVDAGCGRLTPVAPTGRLRLGLVEAPVAGMLFVLRRPDGTADGVTAELGADLARTVGVPADITLFPNTGAAVEAIQAETVDVSFMPVDEFRRGLVAFGPGYYQIESTYLVSRASGITDVAEVDRAGLRVVAIAGTTTFRASARTLKAIQPVPVATVAEALERMRSGQADAFALSADTLQSMLPQVPGSRIATGFFQQTLVAVAVPKGRPEALAYVTNWMEAAKRNGLVRQALDKHGVAPEGIAP